MTQTNGFLRYAREDNTILSPQERLSSFEEFHVPLTEEERR